MLQQELTREDNLKIDTFVHNCQDGDIGVAVGTYNSMGEHIRHYALNGYPFQVACFYGHLHIAAWLHSLHPEVIPEHYNEAFYLACSAGHGKIARWLYSLGCIDIYREKCRAFNRAKINGHRNILAFYTSLDKRFIPLSN